MRFLLNSSSHRNLSTPALYGSRNGQKRFAFPDQSLPLLCDIDARAFPEWAVTGTSRRMAEGKSLGLWNGSSKHGPNSLHNNPLRAFVLCIIHPGFLRSIFSWASGHQREREIATYTEAERFRTSEEEKACRALDIYV